MSDANVIDVSGDNIFTVRTYHGTTVFVDENFYIRHKKINDTAEINHMLYAQLTDTALSLFIIKNGSTHYISAITNAGKALSTNEPCKVAFVRNVVDESIAVGQNGQYWAAHKRSDAFVLTNRNLTWEHLFLEKVDSVDSDKVNVILLAFNENFLDKTLARLNDNANVEAALLEGIDDEGAKTLSEAKKIPIAPLNQLLRFSISKRDCLWLLCGYKNSPEELKGVAEYIQRQGIDRAKIINIFPKMNVEPIWLANVNLAATGECDFIVTGGMRAAFGLNVDKIVGQKGINLAAVGQDLHQSYLTCRYVLERNSAIKFVLIGLTPEDFNVDDDKYFSDRSKLCRYLFDDGRSTIGDKIFHSFLNDELEFPSEEVQPDPNLVELKTAGDGVYSVSDFKTNGDIDINDRALQQLEDYAQLCFEHKVKPVVVLLPSIKGFYSSEKINLLRRVLKYSQKALDLVFIDLFEVPLNAEHFSTAERLNIKGAVVVSGFINAKLHINGLLPIEDLRTMNYEQLQDLRGWLGKDEYNDMMDRIFSASIDVIKRKDKIKISFVVYDPAMWCGDLLYRLFERNEHYEPTLFLCLRMDEKSTLIEEVYRNGIEMFKARGINVVGINSHNVAIPKQDILIYLTPYFGHLPKAFRRNRITAETLLTYIPYGFRTTYWNISKFNINFIAWKLFMDSKTLVNFISRNRDIHSARLVYSGLPKMDTIYLDQQNPEHKSEVEWKMTQPDAIKIIWAPHWSIKGFTYHTLSTFQWNYNFMYEYAAAHPETSWIVKPHPQLLHSAVSSKLFPSTEAFKEYLNKWDELPNARVVTGGYYQDIFETSDAMILDSGSFIAEYQFTHKPMLFLTRQGARFSELGNAIIAANYHVDGKDFDGIKNFIEEVLIKKNDTQLETRNKVFDKELNYLKDNGMLASEKIFRTIDDAFQS